MDDSHPRWTLLGTLSTPARALVDGRGRVATAPGWALDWWVGADDRWHLPQAEASVRQHLVGDAPVVETAMHIPGGDAVHRAYAMRDRGPDGAGRDLLVVEIENQSAVPFALALVVGPFDAYQSPSGGHDGGSTGGAIERLALEGTVLRVDGRPGLVMAKGPARAASVTDWGELESLVVSGQAADELAPVWSPEGHAGAALIYPLPHTAVLRVVLPLDAATSTRPTPTRRRGGRGRASTPGSSPDLYPVGVPTGEQVAKGWEVQTRRPMTVSIPDARWTAVTEASRAFLLLGVPPAGTWAESVTLVGALDRWGFADEAAQALEGLADPAVDPRPVDAAALVALADHWQLTRHTDLVERSAASIAAGVRRVDRPRRRSRRTDPTPPDRVAAELTWRVRGFEAAATLLDASGQPEAAIEVRRRLAPLVSDPVPTGGRPVGPTAGPVADPDLGGALRPAATLLAASADLVDAANQIDRGAGGAAVARALDRLAWSLAALSPTLVWPEAVDPAHPDGAVGRGHDLVAGAAWLVALRDLLVVESDRGGPPGLALCSALPDSWRGQSFEIHHAPTAYGTLSYAVRWHGARPALLWELEPHPDLADTPVVLRAPGLDPSWSTVDRRGDALLAGPELPQASPEPGASFS